MTHRIKVQAETNTTSVFSGHITDELTGDEILTRTSIGRVTFQRFRSVRSLVGTGNYEAAIDESEIEVPVDEYRLYDAIQPGLDYSTSSIPYTFLWRIPETREPFFEEAGTYIVVFRFYPRESGEVERLTFEVTVS